MRNFVTRIEFNRQSFMKYGYDNEKYVKIQSDRIKERIATFGNKLYMEFGGKLFDDYHASRVLPGFEPDSKFKMLYQLKDDLEIVIADFVFLDIDSGYDDDDLHLIAQLHEHLELAVRFEARQHAAGVEIVEQLAAEFHIKFVTEMRNAFLDVF